MLLKANISVIAALLLLALMLCKVPSASATTLQVQLLPVYRVKQVNVTAAYVRSLALNTFKIDNAVVQENAEYFYVNSSYPQYLEVYKTGGSIWYTDFSKMLNRSYVPTLPSEQEALTIAQNFLSQNQLLPPVVVGAPQMLEVDFEGFGNTTIEVFTIETNKTVRSVNSLDVLFNFQIITQLATYPIEGPGAKITVSIGDKGEIISLHHAWREVELFGEYPAITQAEAIEIFRAFSMAENLNLTDVRLAYYAESGTDEQKYMQPYYIFDGYYTVHGKPVAIKTQMIPATSFSPMASITKPSDYSIFTQGNTITFEASVVNGLPPCTYIWESDVDGVIGNEASFNLTLSVNVQNKKVLPHTITLTVIDANGMEATDSIEITVAPRPVEGLGALIERLLSMTWWIILAVAIVISLALGYTAGKRRARVPRKELIGALFLAILAMSTMTFIPVSVYAAPNDDGVYEVGIWWVNRYDKGKLRNNDNNARGFAKKLVNEAGWRWAEPLGDKGDWGAWEVEFRYRYRTPFPRYGQGGDYLYGVDSVDFAFFSGHGFAHGFCFRTSWDDPHFYCWDARWGGNEGGESREEADLEWIVLDACNCLEHSPPGKDVYQAWRRAFDGLHAIFGFHTTCTDVKNRGRKFASKLVTGWELGAAWRWATQQTEGSGKIAAFLYADPYLTTSLPPRSPPGPDPYPPTTLTYAQWTC